MSTQLDTVTPTELQAADQGAQTFQLLQQAVQAGADPENLAKLLDLQERVQNREAQAQINNALAEFQARVPSVEKRKEVRDRGGRLLYKFAPLEDVVAQIRPLLAELGLSFTFGTDQGDRGVDITCYLHHRGGGSIASHVLVPATKGHNTNAAQDAGIALSYGKRYALINVLGITTADEDAGAGQDEKPITAAQAATIKDLISGVKADERKFLNYLRVESVEQIQAKQYDAAIAALQAKGARK